MGKNSESGMTLIEVMVVATLLSIMAVAATQFFVNIARQQKQAQMKANILQIQMMSQAIANNPAAVNQSGMKTESPNP